MNVILIFPPLTDPTQPYSSLPALTAFLREHGWESVQQIDLNIEFVRHSLARRRLEEVLAQIENRLTELNERDSLRDQEAIEYGLLIRASLKAPFVVEGIDRAIESLKHPECFKDLGRLNSSKRTVHEAMEMLSAAVFPLRLGFSNPTNPPLSTTAELVKWVREKERNPYYEFFEAITLPKLKSVFPDAIGISITYRSQVLAAMTLASLLKENFPGIPIIFGGNMVSCWYDTLEACPGLFLWCDYLIAFEGETSLHSLLGALRDGLPYDGVPNLIYRSQGEIKKNPLMMEQIDSLPAPDYRGLPLELYLSPENVFLLYTSRGCYWSRCRFCSVSASMRMRYRVRNIEKVHRDLITIKQRHNAKYIAFADDCVSPATLESLAGTLKKKGPEVYWQCEVRFEAALTSRLLEEIREAGCLNLIFGLESYSPEVLSLMDKGVQHDQIERILEDCRRHGIAFNLQFFFGFPGESARDAEMTIEFVRKQAHGAATFSFSTFELQRGSIVERNSGAFGIHYVDRTCGPLSVKYDYAPLSVHAEKLRASLRQEFLARIEYPYVGLSINAHTLIFLREAGIPALEDLYKKTGAAETRSLDCRTNLMECRLVPRKKQTIGAFDHARERLIDKTVRDTGGEEKHVLLYDYTLDKIVEISPLVVWILQGLDGNKTPSGLIDLLLEEIDDEEGKDSTRERLLATTDIALSGLYERGFFIRQ